MTYRSGAKVNELSELGQSLGDEIPSRMTFGVAYEYTGREQVVNNVIRQHQFAISAEVQRFSSANDASQLDQRDAVTNFHVGAEYIPGKPWLPIPFIRKLTEDGTKPAYVEPIRIGFRTNKAGNRELFADENILSLGVALYYGAIGGAARGQYDISIEPTVEYLMDSGLVFFTISGNYRF